MLHLETVEPGTFSLLKEIMVLPDLRDFSLVGGTALSLKYGHRVSIDLDIFSHHTFENQRCESALNSYFGDRINIRTSTRFGIFCYIDNIKVDIVRFPHPLIRPIVEEDGVRMYSLEDIVAMKVQAILGRAKKKDFWDIAELLQHFSVAQFESFHKEKYSTQNLLITVPQAIVYFDDAEDSEEPVSLKGQTWKKVKKVISTKVRSHLT